MTEQYTPGFNENTPVHSDNVVPLGTTPVVEPSPVAATRPQGSLHRAAIAGMTICAIVGILSMLAFITVSWPEESRRYVVAVFIGSGVGFLASASIAVFSAARETYARPRTSDDSNDQPD